MHEGIRNKAKQSSKNLMLHLHMLQMLNAKYRVPSTVCYTDDRHKQLHT